jgi:flagellar motor switch protein FliN/FliY
VNNYRECWIRVAAALFSQALAGAPELTETIPKPFAAGAFGFTFTLAGEEEGPFSVILDRSALDTPLVGEGVDQKTGWAELLREIADSAAGELLAKAGKKCRVESVAEISETSSTSQGFELKSASGAWNILVRDETHEKLENETPQPGARETLVADPQDSNRVGPGYELLLDVELEVTLRFGCRELPLGEILNLGPGDVVELDRHVADPVDLVVGDKIVARGDVVLVNGNFALRVSEVIAPRKRLETIRCLF